MTALFRSFVVWLMLLALPYQGYAAAQMQLCTVPAVLGAAAAIAMEMPSGPHDHAAMLAAQKQDGGQANHHSNVKCSGSACCAASAPLLALAIPAPLLPPSAAVPFYSDSLPAVDLAHPERPPQGRCA